MAWKWCRSHRHKVQPLEPPLLRSSRVMGLHQGPRFPQVCSEWTNEWKVYISKVVESYGLLWWCITAHLFEERICNRHLQDHWKWSTNASNRCLTPSPFVKADGRHTFPKSWACRQNFYHTSHPKKKQQKQFPHQVSKIKIQIWKTTFNWQIEKRTWNFPPKTQSPPRS